MIKRLLCSYVLLAAIPAVWADATDDLLRTGHDHYAAEQYAEALVAYEEVAASMEGPPVAELLHNQAAAQFKLGNLDEARELWVRALALKDAAFEARARYNLGNCDYTQALSAMQSGGEAGVGAAGLLEPLERAMRQYHDAIRLDPGLADARANLELAHQLKKMIEENATSQPQSQLSSQQSDQQEQDENQQQSSSQPSDQQSEQEKSEQDDAQQSPTSQPEQPEEQPPSSQPENQSQPEQQPQPEQDQSAEASEQEAQPVNLTREEAERLLQMIRDAEQARRQALRAREAARHKPVKRDW
ncbi:MAG: hypothetical protein ABIG44_00510 [Planctomycetota bacterium]